jgi:hypothetical protein
MSYDERDRQRVGRRRQSRRAGQRREQPRRAVDHLALGQLAGRLDAAHRDRHRPMSGQRADRERAARHLRRLIGRDLALGVDHHDRRAIGELLHVVAERPDRPFQRVLGEWAPSAAAISTTDSRHRSLPVSAERESRGRAARRPQRGILG